MKKKVEEKDILCKKCGASIEGSIILTEAYHNIHIDKNGETELECFEYGDSIIEANCSKCGESIKELI